ncbi:hypothetical protein Tco_1248468 [Tanacetum coccineum]
MNTTRAFFKKKMSRCLDTCYCFTNTHMLIADTGIGDEELIVELQTLPGKELPPWPVSGRAGFSLDSEVLGIHSSWLPLLFGSCASFWVVAPSFHSPFMVDAMLARPLHSSWSTCSAVCKGVVLILAYSLEFSVYGFTTSELLHKVDLAFSSKSSRIGKRDISNFVIKGYAISCVVGCRR